MNDDLPSGSRNADQIVEAAGGDARRLRLRDGGWVVLVTIAACLGIVVWATLGVVLRGDDVVGDGRTVESYGFDLSNLSIPFESIAASGRPRDFLQALEPPGLLAGGDMLAHNAAVRGLYVVTTDRVVGVMIDGEARAYPVRVLAAHEIVLDELAGVPIAVAWSPLSDAPVVFDRRVVEGGPALEFGLSGLVADAGLLMYDRAPDPSSASTHESSLVAPQRSRVVAGPLEGTPLERIGDVSLCRWDAWLRAHPYTDVILPDPDSRRRYKAISYARYLIGDDRDLMGFPVAEPPSDLLLDRLGLAWKSPVVVLERGDARAIVPLPWLVEAAAARNAATVDLPFDGDQVVLRVQAEPAGYLTESLPDEVIVAPMLLFAAHAAHPDGFAANVVDPRQVLTDQ